MRILSLLPAATEIVCALDAAGDLVGISHECDYPDEITHLPRVTSSIISRDAPSLEIDDAVRALVAEGKPVFALDRDEIVRLAPELILAQSLCDVCAVGDGVAQSLTNVLAPAPVVVLPLVGATLGGVWNDIRAVAGVIGRRDAGSRLLSALDQRILAVHERLKAHSAPRPRVAVVEWLEPLFAAGHWTPELVRRAGGVDVISEPGAHSRQISVSVIEHAAPELLVFAPCGFDVERAYTDARSLLKRPEWAWAGAVKDIWAVDGNALTSRPGPRLADAIEVFAGLTAPDLFAEPSRTYARRIK